MYKRGPKPPPFLWEKGAPANFKIPVSLYRRGPFPNIREFKHSNTIFVCLKTVPILCMHVECTQGRRNILLIG